MDAFANFIKLVPSVLDKVSSNFVGKLYFRILQKTNKRNDSKIKQRVYQ